MPMPSMSSTGPHVRPARSGDVDAVLTFLSEVFAGDETLPDRVELEACLRSGASYLLVAVEGRTVVGVVLLRDLAFRPWTVCAFLGVAPEGRGRGIGAALLRAALQIARRPLFRLWVRASNAPARRLYEAHGWRVWARHAAHYPDGCDGLVMMRWMGWTRGVQAAATVRGRARKPDALSLP